MAITDELKNSISESLKRFRVAHKLTQKNVALALNISPQLYNHYETKGDLSVVTLLQIANIYGVSTDYLLGLTNQPNVQNAHNDNNKLITIAELLNQVLNERGLKVSK